MQIKTLRNTILEQREANFFQKGLNSQNFRFCRMYDPCSNLCHFRPKEAIDNMQTKKHSYVPKDFIYGH